MRFRRVGARLLAAALCSATLAASRSSTAEEPNETFVLIVTNNHSPALARPSLHYADDDGAKYYELFRMIAPEQQTFLLSAFDRDTKKLFPQLASKLEPPDRAHVLTATREIAARVGAAKAAGKSVDFYFVFAGHGDVDEGRGFLELVDGRFTSDDLSSLLASIGATRSHVILDSCNSFFVIQARKPGGRHFVTAEDTARALSQRLPNVGVFVSTSAEAEVFEWSELQAGIFSHAVRSGLSGAADVDADGTVSYAELRAFVNVASSEVKNPHYRPKVFARGPSGEDKHALLKLNRAEAATLLIKADGEARLTVRDADELPRVDVHKEDGTAVALRLPSSWGARAVEDAAFTNADPRLAARGASEMFRALFAQPFGPRAFDAYQRSEAARAPEVYGVSTDDRERMRLLVGQVADSGRRQRQYAGALYLGTGAAMMGAGIFMLATRPPSSSDEIGHDVQELGGWSLLPLGVASMISGGLSLGVRSSLERLYDDYLQGVEADPLEISRVVARTEARLFELADEHRRDRHVQAAIFLGAGALTLGAIAFTELRETTGEYRTALRYSLPLLGGISITAGMAALMLESDVEQLARAWASDPSSQRMHRPAPRHSDRVRLLLTPTAGGGFAGVGGTF